jgi:hypothetical protein
MISQRLHMKEGNQNIRMDPRYFPPVMDESSFQDSSGFENSNPCSDTAIQRAGIDDGKFGHMMFNV